jgi:hypothetical protein
LDNGYIQHQVERGLIKDKIQAEEAKEKAHLDYDGVLVAGAILRFFPGEEKEIS